MRILVLGEVLQPSGYATVLQGLLPHLEAHFDLHVFDRGAASDNAAEAPAPPPGARWALHANRVRGDVWGIEQLPALLDRLRPDVVWIVYDAILYLVHRELLAAWPTVLYCPIDGVNPEPESLRHLAGLARLVLFTATARRAVEAAAPTDAPLPPIDILPHGVDIATFRPVADRAALRRRLFGLDRGFVVLNANRNNRRKRPDLTIAGFARFVHDSGKAGRQRDAWLCLHMDSAQDYDLRALAAAAGIEDRVLWSDRPLSPAGLNDLYNACDAGINNSAGEGWGLVSFEHAATGAPQIVPRHSACAELWHDAGVFLEPAGTSRAPLALCENQDVTAEGLADALARLYGDDAYRQDYAGRAWRTATSPHLAWPHIAAQWRSLFARLGPTGPPAPPSDAPG
jgi:glycosyltransferase involved in cell wall biosynthesis